MTQVPGPPGRHRPPAPGRRKRVDESKQRNGAHRGDVRPRYGRIAVAFSAMTVTAVAVLGNFGVLMPDGAPQLAVANADQSPTETPSATDGGAASGTTTGAEAPATTETDQTDQAEPVGRKVPTRKRDKKTDTEPPSTQDLPLALPEGSGSGRRVVFSESLQRVWLVDRGDEVVRTYPVSGSEYDNLDPGTYEVYSTSRHAVGIDNSGTMEFFVRFTQGDAGAAIGFHTIPVQDGEPVQTERQLGVPLSHGCIRQARPDAVALWEFAPIGTTVVVTI